MIKQEVRTEYKIHDKINAVYEIRKAMEEEQEETYLLTGVWEKNTFFIHAYEKIQYKQEKKHLLSNVLEVIQKGITCFFLNTHPTQFQRQLAENERDKMILTPMYECYLSTNTNCPIFFGIIGKENVSIKAYGNKQFYDVTYQSCYEIGNHSEYEVEFLLEDTDKTDKNPTEGILRFTNSKREVRLPFLKWNALKQWKEQRERKELPQLHEIAYQNLLVEFYELSEK